MLYSIFFLFLKDPTDLYELECKLFLVNRQTVLCSILFVSCYYSVSYFLADFRFIPMLRAGIFLILFVHQIRQCAFLASSLFQLPVTDKISGISKTTRRKPLKIQQVVFIFRWLHSRLVIDDGSLIAPYSMWFCKNHFYALVRSQGKSATKKIMHQYLRYYLLQQSSAPDYIVEIICRINSVCIHFLYSICEYSSQKNYND